MDLIKIVATVFTTAGILGIITQSLNLPIIIAYLATGLIIGPLGLNIIPMNGMTIDGLTTLGIVFMLFLVGLELDIKKIKSIGLVSFIITFWQVVLLALAGFIGSQLLGFSLITSIYIGIALSFSSTVIVVKNLTDTNQLASLHGRLLMGILLTQDIFAIVALIFVQGVNSTTTLNNLITVAGSLIIFAFAAYLIRRYIISWLFGIFSKTPELIFIASIAWALFLSVLAASLGFSPAIGAFIAGVTLATVPYADEIRGKIRWLRDFFIVLFLSLIGSSLVGHSPNNILIPIIVFSLIVILGKIIIVLILMGISGFRRRTSFIVSLSISQISEFSFILIALVSKTKILDPGTTSIILFTGLLTMAISSLLTMKTNSLFHYLSNPLKFFERPGHFREDFHELQEKLEDHVVLFGAHRVGHPVLERLQKLGHAMVVVDFDPMIIKHLRGQGLPAIYGDMGDPELVEHLNLEHAKMVISTTHDFLDTQLILKKTSAINKKAITFVTAANAEEALILYKEGADYVILPHRLSGEFLADLITEVKATAPKTTENILSHRKQRHIEELTKLIEKEIPA